MNVYVDTSALVKRAVREPESDQLVAELAGLADSGERLFASTLAWIETTRTIRSRMDDSRPQDAADLIDVALSGIIEYSINNQVADVARRLGPTTLRSLDAIHLATATLIGADLVCAYDQRLLAAAQELGFRTVSPGVGDPASHSRR